MTTKLIPALTVFAVLGYGPLVSLLRGANEEEKNANILEFKTMVVMADLQGMDYTDVAVAVRVPLGTIKSRLARARLRLRECLQGFEELLPSVFRLEEESTA